MSIALARGGAILATALMFSLYSRVEQPWALLGAVALVPWLCTLERERTVGAAVASGALMSAAFVLAVFPWFATAVSRYTGTSAVLAFALLFLAGPLLQPQFLVFAAVRHVVAARGRGPTATGLAAACAWVATEWLCPHLFGDTLGHGLFPFPRLRQAADLAGAAGLTFVVLTVNESVHAMIARRPRSARRVVVAAAPAVLLLAALAVYGSLRLRLVAEREPDRAPLTAALVQANLADYAGLRARFGTYEAVRRILSAHEALSRQALAADASRPPVELLIWPETVYPTTFGAPKSTDGAAFDAQIVEFSEDVGTPLLFGTYDREGGREFNSAVLLQKAADGGVRSEVYRKRRLFPLTEQVPAWLEHQSLRDRFAWLGTWHSGQGSELLSLRRSDGDTLRLAPLICLDAVDPSLAIDAARHGAELIVALSNDGWFAGTRGARLHLVVSAFRSIETRLPQLRGTNTGVSAAISATGEILARSPASEATVLTSTVTPGNRGPTLMVGWGDWFGPATFVAAAALVALACRARPRVLD